jgi:hypothetical protein
MGPVSFEDPISPALYELEREAIFKGAWLNVGRMERGTPHSKKGSPTRNPRAGSPSGRGSCGQRT